MRFFAGLVFLGVIIWFVGLPFIGAMMFFGLLSALGNFALGGDHK
jgi:hypothetical protein